MRLFASLTLALSLAIALVSPSLGHTHLGRRHHVHHDLARRDPGDISLYKRFDNARFTYFQVGLGACGATSQSTDFVVALDSDQYDTGSYCFQTITITANGKTAQATIVDRCPGCPTDGLDFSSGLFQFFADLSVGVLTGSWNFDSGGSSPSPSPSPSPTPSTTSVDMPATTWLPSPTSTSQPPPTTTTTSASSTTSSSSSTTTVSSSASSLAPTQTTTNVAAQSAVPGAATNSSVLSDVNLSIVLIGQFLVDSSSMQ